jgi:N6-adenosine-specific RNA methylase IME4
MLEQYFPTLPKIEINRRGAPRPGWDAWGDEVEPTPAETNSAHPSEQRMEISTTGGHA